MRLLKRIFNLRGDLGSLFGSGGNQVANIQTPTFQQNQSYNNASNQLSTLGTNILSGNLPSYYSSLGNPNSSQFQALQQNLIGQTNAASAQQAAASGTDRSGVAATAAASSLANTLPALDFSNLQNAQSQQQALLGLGSNITNDVAGLGLQDQSQVNAFNQQNFQDQFQQAAYNNQYNVAQGNALGSLIGSGLSVGLGALTGGLAGGGLAGIAAGAGQGAGLGSFSGLLNSINGINGGGNSGTNQTFNGLNANPINYSASGSQGAGGFLGLGGQS